MTQEETVYTRIHVAALPPLISAPFHKKQNQCICAYQGLMGTVTDGANDVCLSRGSALVRARLVTYAQSQGHHWSTAAPNVQETPP